MNNVYKLIDINQNHKLEQVSGKFIIRPAGDNATTLTIDKNWTYDLFYNHKEKSWYDSEGQFIDPSSLNLKPAKLENEIKFTVSFNNSGNIGFFPEHQLTAEIAQSLTQPGFKVLNLFSYSGTSALPLLKKQIDLTNVDSSKNSHNLFAENVKLNNLSGDVRTILEDSGKFVEREKKRGKQYDLILTDPPTFGRGKSGEIFKLNRDWQQHLRTLADLKSENAKIIFTHHSRELTPNEIVYFIKKTLRLPVTHRENSISSLSKKTLNSGQLFVIG